MVQDTFEWLRAEQLIGAGPRACRRALGSASFCYETELYCCGQNRSGVSAMGKGQEKPNKGNKPKLSVKDKKEKKKEKAAAKGG